MPRGQVDRLAGVHAPGDVADNAVAQLGRVEQAHGEQRGAVLQRGVLGEALSPRRDWAYSPTGPTGSVSLEPPRPGSLNGYTLPLLT